VHRFLALLADLLIYWGSSRKLATLKHPAASSLPGCAAQRQRQGGEYSRQRG